MATHCTSRSVFGSLFQTARHRAILPPAFLLPAFAQSAPFSSSPSVSDKPKKTWNNSARGISAIKRSGLNKRIKLSVSLSKLPRPILDPSLRSKVTVNENHGLWGFFNAEKNALMTPEQLHAHGRGWTVQELRVKGWEDLHRLWWVCCKELNRIWTYEIERKRLEAGYGEFEALEREKQVRQTMKAIRHVLTERWYAWDNARMAAMEDPEVDLYARPEMGQQAYIPGAGAEVEAAELQPEKLPFQAALGSYQPQATPTQQQATV